MKVNSSTILDKSSIESEWIMEFKWDNHKALINMKKHKISFQEAATIFADPLAMTFDDPDHSVGEHRILTFGTTRVGKTVVISHTQTNNEVRLISARLMTKQERKMYEEG